MEKDLAVPVKLNVWQATSEYVLLEQYWDEVKIKFKIWNDDQEVLKEQGILTFSGVWSLKYNRNKKTRYYHPEVENDFRSSYQIVPNSSWLDEVIKERSGYDSNWRQYDKRDYKHYIVQNNAYYIEVIAQKVEFTIE